MQSELPVWVWDMTMEFNPTRLYWGPQGGEPMDLSGSVTTVTMRFAPDPYEYAIGKGWFKPITFRGRLRLTPLGFRVLFGRQHPRIRRMHSAYSRKRGRGRW